MWRNTEKLEKVCGRVFVSLFLFLLLATQARLLLSGEKNDPLELEGRRPEKMPTFTRETFLDGTFQEQSEKALSDQTPMSETIRAKYLFARNSLFNGLSWLSYQENSNYKLVSDDLYTYKNYDYLVNGNTNKTYNKLSGLESSIDDSYNYYNSLPINKKYQYIATNDSVLNFDNIDYGILDWFESKYPTFKQAYLNISDFDTYMSFFYKNDHHWNYKGSYQGYKDIINLMFGPNEKPLQPAEEIIFNYDTKGSRSRFAPYTNFHENFAAYRFVFKKHETYVEGYKSTYGHQEEYFNNKELRSGEGDISYGDFYGYDVSTIEYDFNQPKKENLIIVGYSYTNALNELVASHFNKTWVIDTRFCSREEFEKIIAENKIQNLLLLPNAGSYITVMPEAAKGYDE